MMTHFLNKIKQKLQQDKMVVIHCKITPSSATSKFIEIMDDETVKVAISAPPEKGKANKELIKFLSKELGVEKFNIEIIAGATTKNKLIRLKA